LTIPDLSIIVCTWNRSTILPAALDSILRAARETDAALEVIVVNNNCTDDTPAVIARYAAAHPIIRGVEEKQQGLSHARNRGLQEARAAWVLYLDDDSTGDVYWLRNGLAFLRQHPELSAMGGDVLLEEDVVIPGFMDRKLMAGALRILDGGTQPIAANMNNFGSLVFGGNMWLYRDTARELGGFNPELGMSGGKAKPAEETDLVRRLLVAGKQVSYAPAVITRTRLFPIHYTRRYYYRWFWQGGISASEMEDSHGLPRWCVRKVLTHGAGVVGAYLTFREALAHYHICHTLMFSSYILNSLQR
jgi:glucosyl-dolichyl phosphate glucuronosyltransferase